jgi:hypothetical protein
MVDKMQSFASTWYANDGTRSVPTANHRNNNGVPIGANFLYEDGSVLWRKFNLANLKGTIDVGSISGSWTVYFRPGDLGTGPW